MHQKMESKRTAHLPLPHHPYPVIRPPPLPPPLPRPLAPCSTLFALPFLAPSSSSVSSQKVHKNQMPPQLSWKLVQSCQHQR
ncbi:hypothetical protein PCANC_02168 [Puccinia coronata f. sp. avenae]|uniref:Uncharacterized protein n=1 Tax=Puccinia coronata f. sp. avenae TaxID=200324 RepID=A0A2N5W050_9BASI|nr:hypothetical protein PCANC_02168 [Puccinia coronata f. sp. avenae]